MSGRPPSCDCCPLLAARCSILGDTRLNTCRLPTGCLAAVAQVLSSKNLKSTGAISFPSAFLQMLAAALRQATGVESGTFSGQYSPLMNLTSA